MSSNILVGIPVMALLTIIQTSVLPQFDLFDVTPSLPFLFALAWALLVGVDDGIVWAFVGGLFMDIFTIAPVGGLSLSYMAGVFVAGLIKDLLPANQIAVPVLFTVTATAVQQLLYFIYLRLFGIPFNTTLASFIQIIIVQALLILPIYGSMYLIKRTLRPSPVKI